MGMGEKATFQQQKQHGRQSNILFFGSALRLAREEEEEEEEGRDHDESVAEAANELQLTHATCCQCVFLVAFSNVLRCLLLLHLLLLLFSPVRSLPGFNFVCRFAVSQSLCAAALELDFATLFVCCCQAARTSPPPLLPLLPFHPDS